MVCRGGLGQLGVQDATLAQVHGAGGQRSDRGPMRRRDDRATFDEPAQRLDNEILGVDVQAGGGFVEEHDGGVDEQCAGDADALALPAGQPGPAGTDGGVEPVGEVIGELGGVRLFV